MDYQTVDDWKTANPFEPFRVVMTDGRSYEIRHPNLVWPGKATLLVGIQEPQEPEGVFGRYVSVAMLHVVRIEPLTAAATATP